MKNIIKIFLAAISIIIIIVLLCLEVTGGNVASEENPSFATNSGDEFPNLKIAEDYFAMKQKNPDTVGWLAVPNVCYYPVMYSGDNSYYLNHDENGNESVYGALFLNADSTGDFSKGISVIHGHHMKDGSMFGHLKSFKDETFFQTNSYFEFFDGKTLRLYKQFTVLLLKDGQEFIDQSGKSAKDHEKYMKELYEQSKLPMAEGEKPDFTKPALFLSTCDYSFDDARLVVGGYMVKSYEYTKK